MPDVSSMWLRAVLETKSTVFPNTDRPRPANNMFIFFYWIIVKGPKMSIMGQKLMLMKKTCTAWNNYNVE